MLKDKDVNHFTLKKQLRILLLSVLGPFSIMLAVVLGMLSSFNHTYAGILQNVSTVSQFNSNFKADLDLDMYHYAVESRYMGHLPLEEVEKARACIYNLQATTTLQKNQRRVSSLLRLCDRLSACMREIADTKDYNARMEKLELNIYSLTKLIQDYMNLYLRDEVKVLSALQQNINQRVSAAVVCTIVVSVLLTGFAIWYALRLSKGIIQPVSKLCDKVEQLGRGNFDLLPIKARNTELQTLDDGFNKMAQRMNKLMDNIRRSQEALRHTEMELLQSQINPHFLYNTFDSIIWLAEGHKDDEVIKMTTNLSTFFRNSLSKGADVITLEAETQQVKSYLAIQQVRYQDILACEISIPQNLLSCHIPKLTLQPLVENAIYHGIKNKRGGGKITITGEQHDGNILLRVKDDGAGMSPEQLEKLRRNVDGGAPEGVGLRNVDRRLKLYFGSAYGLRFDSRLGQGTSVTVCIPKQNKLCP